jgi:hypothetical protein
MKKVIEAFRRGGGKDKPMYLKVQLSYDRTEEDALQGAWEQWRTVDFSQRCSHRVTTTEHLDAAAVFISPEEMRKHVLISSDMEKHKMWLKEYFEMGFANIYLHNVNLSQETFIQDFGKHVLPSLTAREGLMNKTGSYKPISDYGAIAICVRWRLSAVTAAWTGAVCHSWINPAFLRLFWMPKRVDGSVLRSPGMPAGSRSMYRTPMYSEPV